MQDVSNKKKVQGSKLKEMQSDQNWVANWKKLSSKKVYPPTTEKQIGTFKPLTPISCSASGKNVIDKSKVTNKYLSSNSYTL